MSILVGPDKVTTLCACGTQGLRSQYDNLEARNPSPLGCSRVRAIRSNGGKTFQSLLAGPGSGNFKNAMFSTESGILLTSVPSRRKTLNLCKLVRSSQVRDNDDCAEVSTSGSEEASCPIGKNSWSGWRVAAVGAMSAGILFFGPSVDTNDLGIPFAADLAIAATIPVGQMRPGTMMLDKLLGPFKSSRVLDKVVTVVSGQVVVNPTELEKELKELVEAPDGFEKWRNGVLDNVQDGIGTAYDVISNFTPEGVQESLSTSVTGFFEAGAERFAAFELSTLVGLTERWLIYIPFVVLPMAWQMRARSNARAEDRLAREERRLVLSEENKAKAERVRLELERIRLKASLLDIIESLGETALRPPQNGAQLRGKDIEDIVSDLKVLNPAYEVQLSPSDPGSTMRSGSLNDAFSSTPAAPELDGDWSLVYVSEQLQNADVSRILGVEVHNPRQQVWHQGSSVTPVPSLNADTLGSSLLVAKNVAELRLGPFGVVEIAVQGSWEKLRNGQAGIVSFDTFMVRPREVLGTRFGDDLPSVSLSLPQALQQIAEWEVWYLDETLRINQGRQGQLFIFTKKS